MTTYKDKITEAMTELGKDADTVFIGYNVHHGNEGGGTLAGVPKEQRIETPLAENLMAGLATGMSLDGKIPVLFFERMDFICNALDNIVCHLDKLAILSEGMHRPAAIIRCVIGNTKTPLYTGVTHTQNLCEGMRHMVGFPVIELLDSTMIDSYYTWALKRAKAGQSTLLAEFKDLYNNPAE